MTDFIALPSKTRLIIGFFCAALFLFLSFWMIGIFGKTPVVGRYSEERVIFTGFTGIVFSLSLMIYIGWNILSPRFIVSISPEGIIANEWGKDLIPWCDLDEIGEYNMYGQKMLVINIKNRSYISKPLFVILSAIYRKIYGFDILLNLSHSDRTQKEAMNAIYFFRPTSDTVRT